MKRVAEKHPSSLSISIHPVFYGAYLGERFHSDVNIYEERTKLTKNLQNSDPGVDVPVELLQGVGADSQSGSLRKM